MSDKSRFCFTCNKKFKPEHVDQAYCSRECQSGINLHRRLYKCDVCGKFYRPSFKNQTICSARCKKHRAETRGRFLILDRDDFTCIYCGKSSVTDPVELHLDHVVPRSKGGEDAASNLVTACIRCNSEKSAIPLSNPDFVLSEIERRNDERGINSGQRIDLTVRA